jgi:lactate dehydrogenase-like 2-hydroxyacid dehydrogenase
MFKAECDVRPAGSGASCGQLRGAPAKGEIGLVGLGHMGMAMALNLIAGGHRVIGYVRRRDQMSRLVALGLKVATDIGEFVAWGPLHVLRRPAIYSNVRLKPTLCRIV